MAYFSYHAKAKKLIREGHLCNYYVVQNHNGISPALMLVFDNHVPMPIRVHRWNEYFELFDQMDNKKDE